MAVKDISEVVAANLAYWMKTAKLTQAALGERAGVSQKTISNYLNPDQRAEGASGKPGSPKLHELDRIAKALDIEVWQLTREMTEPQRAMYDAIERAYQDLLRTVPDAADLHRQAEAGEQDADTAPAHPARKGSA